jgi:hypothetical protein
MLLYRVQECKSRGVSIHGVINAAALKAVAAYKRVGARGEHYGTTVMLQCRDRLQPILPESAIGNAQFQVFKSMTVSGEVCKLRVTVNFL